MTSSDATFSIRDIALAAFLPTALFSIGEGAVIPIIPVLAHNLGAGLALAGFIGGMIMVGEMVGDIPSGWVVSRFGERRSMIGSALLCIVGLVICLIAPGDLMLTIGVFLIGVPVSSLSGADKEGLLAQKKGEKIAIESQQRNQKCGA